MSMTPWICYCIDLPTKPEVVRLALKTGRNRREVSGILLEFWAWAAGAAGEDGLIAGVTVEMIPLADVDAAFWAALVEAGWLLVEPAGLRIPKFDRWMSKRAQNRLVGNERRQFYRAKVAAKKDNVSDLSVTMSVTKAGHSPAEPPKRQSKAKTVVIELPALGVLDTPGFRRTWVFWVEARKEMKKPLTQQMVNMQIKKLQAMGLAGAMACLEQSIANGWQGLFPPRGKPTGEPARPQDAVPTSSELRERTAKLERQAAEAKRKREMLFQEDE